MMSKTILDVLTLGDLMVDFTPAGISPKGNLLYERNPGGAPANVAVTVWVANQDFLLRSVMIYSGTF